MKRSNHSLIFLVSSMGLLTFFNENGHSQNTKPKKEIRITIKENGRIKSDTSFEVKRDITKDELDSMIDELQKNKNEFFPRWKHNGEALMDISDFDTELDSMVQIFCKKYEFSTDFDNNQMLEDFFKLGITGDSIYSYKTCPKNDETDKQKEQGQDKNNKGLIIKKINPNRQEMIIEQKFPNKRSGHNNENTISL